MVLSAVVVLASGVNLARTVRADAEGEVSAARADNDLVDRCRADVLAVLDPTLSSAATAGALRTLATPLAASGAHLSTVVAGTAGQLPTVGSVDVAADAAAGAPGLEALVTAAQGATGRSGPSSWTADLAAAADTAGELPRDRPLLVTWVTTGDVPEAAAAAVAALRARPDTHLVGVAAGPAATQSAALGALVGPDLVAAGTRAIDPARDDVVLVDSPDGLDGVLAQLSGGLCATNVHVDVLDSATQPPTARADVGLVLAAAPGGADLAVSPGISAQSTDARGGASWQVAVPTGTTANLTLRNVAAPATQALVCTGADGLHTVGYGPDITILDVPAGADVSCELRLLDDSKPLRLRLVPLPGDVACPDTLEGLAAVTAAVLGGPVTYCMELINDGVHTAVGVQVDIEGLSTGAAWVIEAGVAPSQRVRNRVMTTLGQPLAVQATATAAGMAGDQAGAYVGAIAPAATVEELAADDPRCVELASPMGCYVVANTGGTWLDELALSLHDFTFRTGPDRRIAPGQRIVLVPPPAEERTPRAPTRTDAPTDAASGPELTARATDAAGMPLPLAAVTSAPAADAPLLLAALASDDAVPLGKTVDYGVTVTNPGGGASYDAVSVDDSACDEPSQPTPLVGDGDGVLDGGETWLFTCSAPVTAELFSTAAVLAQDTTTTTTPTLDDIVPRPKPTRPEVPDLRIKKSQVNDLVAGSIASYELKVQNVARQKAPNVVVADALPAGLTFDSASSTVGSCSHQSGIVTCNLGDLAPQETNESVTVRIGLLVQGTVPADTVLRNEARATSDGSDVDPSDNTSFVRGKVGACIRACPEVVADPGGGDAGGGGGGGGTTGGDGGTAVAGEQLARTGVDTMAASGWALVLLAAGMCLVSTGRRRLAGED